MGQPPRLSWSGTILGAPDPRTLAGFYRRLLGWEVGVDEPDWVVLRPPTDGPVLGFQLEHIHVPPVWPAAPGDQQMMVHLDFQVDDLETAVAYAVAAGAVVAQFQPQQDVRVLIDPAGHPFCLWVDPAA